MGTILCIYVRHFAIRVAASGNLAALDERPLVLTQPNTGRSLVLDTTDEGQDAGLRVGMPLSEALVICPDLVTVYPDPAEEKHIAAVTLDRLEQMSPLVEADRDEPGCWYIDLRGLERHFSSPAQASQEMLASIPPFLQPRVAMAENKFAARIAAGMAPPRMIKVVHPVQTSAFLQGVSVGWLPLPPDTIHHLQRLGIHTLGELAKLPASRVAARFGPEGVRMWNLAQGLDPRPVVARPYVETIAETLAMPTPAISRDMLLVGLRQLIIRMFDRPSLRGMQVREVSLTAALEQGTSWERRIIFKEPYGRQRLLRALELRLHDMELPGPIDSITVELQGISGQVAHQDLLPQLRARRDGSLNAALRHLVHRYTQSPVYRVVEVAPWSRIPERRHVLMTYAS